MRKNLLITLLILSTAFTILLPGVLSASPTITWNTPSVDDTYYWSDFTLNVGTDINANCSYHVTYASNNTELISETLFTNGQDSTSHTTNVPLNSLPHPTHLRVVVACFNATNSSESTTENKTLYNDVRCGDSISTNWTLGHDLDCSATTLDALTITGAGVTLDGNNYVITGATSNTSILVMGSLGDVTIKNIIFNKGKFLVRTSAYGTHVYLSDSVLANVTSSGNAIHNLDDFFVDNVSFYNLSNNFIANYPAGTGLDLTVTNSYFDLGGASSANGIFFQRPSTGQIIIANNTFFNVTATSTVPINLQADTGDYSYINITGNTFNISTGTGTPRVISIEDNVTTLYFYKNRFLNISYGYDLYYGGSNSHYLDYNNQGNYWDHDACPAFQAGVDTNNANVTDRFAYSSPTLSESSQCIECGTALTSSYTLKGDLDCSSYDGNIINITSDLVTLDCAGHTIIGNPGADSSIFAVVADSVMSPSVKNCVINNSPEGIRMRSVLGGLVQNNTLNNVGNGVGTAAISADVSSSSVTITGNRINNPYCRAIYAYQNTGGLTITNNNITGPVNYSSCYAILFQDGIFNVDFSNNQITNASGIRVLSSLGPSITIAGNTLLGNETASQTGLLVDSSQVNFTNNTVRYYDTGLKLQNATGSYYKNLIYDNTLGVAADAPAYIDYNQMGNYWGYPANTCPGFIPGVDSNSTAIIDRYPYTSVDFTDEACSCGDTVVQNTTLYKDVTGCSGNTLVMNTAGVTLDCNSHTLSGTLGSTNLAFNADYTEAMNCIISNSYVGLYANSPLNNITVRNSVITPSAGGEAVEFSLPSGVLFENNTFNLSEGANGIVLANSVMVTIRHNNFIGRSGSHRSIIDWGGNFGIVLYENYWGHNTCSLYRYGEDSTTTNFFDYHPVSQMNNWSSTIHCFDPTIFEGFSGVTVYDDSGAYTPAGVNGYDYYYNGSNEKVYLSDDTELGSPTPWKVYFYYYYPGEDIVFDVDVAPPDYMFTYFGLDNPPFTSYTLTITNLTGLNGSAGTYRVNISNYTLNYSDSMVNSTPSNVDIFLRLADDQGATRRVWINGLYNFTPQQLLTNLGGSTTNWATITDFSSITNMAFEVPGMAKILFLESLNLTDPDFISGLRNLASLMDLGADTVSLDSTELAALNKSANITFYNASQDSGLNASELNATYLLDKLTMNGESCPSSVCTSASYNSLSDEFTVTVVHWTNYTLDLNPPTITSSGPSGEQSSSTTSVTLTATTDEPATCKYDTSDKSYDEMGGNMTGTGTSHTASLSVSSGNSYTYYVRCRDAVNNTMNSSTTISFSVASSSSGSSGGGGGNYYEPSGLSFYPTTVTLSTFGSYKFIGIDNEEHKIIIKELGSDYAVLTIYSKSTDVKLNEGESKNVDIDGDGEYDLYVELVSVSSSSASLKIGRPQKEVSKPPAEGLNDNNEGNEGSVDSENTAENQVATGGEEATTPSESKNETQKAPNENQEKNEVQSSSPWLLITILIIAAAALLVWLLTRKK